MMQVVQLLESRPKQQQLYYAADFDATVARMKLHSSYVVDKGIHTGGRPPCYFFNLLVFSDKCCCWLCSFGLVKDGLRVQVACIAAEEE